jgi:hypothetical protein
MKNNFGTNEGLNLEAISQVVEDELRNRFSELNSNFEVNGVQPLHTIPGKGYTAIGQGEVLYQGEQVGNGTVYTILFRPGDGTGSNVNFEIKGVPSKWTPRIKVDYAEVFLAIGTYYQKVWFPGITSLTEVSTDRNNPLGIHSLPNPLILEAPTLEQAVKNVSDAPQTKAQVPFNFTLHRDRNYGNPHAIIFPEGSWLDKLTPYETFFQVGAFLAFPQRTRELEIIEKKCRGVNP